MTVDEFCEMIFSIQPNNFMGFNGAAAAIVGASSSVSDAVQQLQSSAVQFAEAYKRGNDEAVMATRRDVTAKIMVLATLDAISEKSADELIAVLGQLMKERKR